MSEEPAYLSPTMDGVRALLARGIEGPVVMLNLLRFRDVADYAANPELAPDEPISGREAYRRYMEHTEPLVEASGGRVVFYGRGGPFLIGPADERWDAALLVEQDSVSTFLSFGEDPAILAGLGHRTAALEDSRLLPLVGA
ncbi:MAG: DUF1330 domain-containing protein [Planctomycetota bacterium]